MLITRMTPDQCRQLLSRASVGRLGCSHNDQPYVLPVYLASDGDFIYVFSTYGKKIEWMRANPKVCLQMDEATGPADWSSVIVNGYYQELPEPQFPEERAHARQLLEKRHRWWLNALAERRIQVTDQSIEPLFFRIRVESSSGLRAVSEDESDRGKNKDGKNKNKDAAPAA
ncbi:MAG: pyridoxamine 5'-phosphate oxidase family protein [Candidatus Sulfotelmatobacter sp.]